MAFLTRTTIDYKKPKEVVGFLLPCGATLTVEECEQDED